MYGAPGRGMPPPSGVSMKRVGSTMSFLNLCFLVTGLHSSRPCLRVSSRSPTSPSSWITAAIATRPRGRRPTWRLSSRPGQEVEDSHSDSRGSGDVRVSDFQQTGGPVKLFVGGLTDLFVRFSGDRTESEVASADAMQKASLSIEQLEAGIRNEYAKNYLWTGDINEDLYEEDCSFTDPTLSFSGLSTYKRNVGSLQGILDRLVTNSRSELYSCELREEDSCVQTRWRMVGYLRLPWGPTIDVVGRTTFSYNSRRGNRIFSYDEVWEVEPAEALLQLFKPGRRNAGDPLLPEE